MGLAFSCPGDDALDDGFEALFMRSISFDSDNVKSTLRSFSFNGRDSEPAILKAFGSGKLIIEGSLSFGRRESETFQLETKISIKSPTSSEKENPMKLGSSRFCPSKEQKLESPVVQLSTPKDQAAVKLQKVYKSFRTRRQLADCAVLVEQRWWKLLDFALLKRSSVSFFDIEEPESVVSRWLRARRRAATVGKGLSKDDKARKLALQHWLEAIDPRHRYGHSLHFYYVCWLHCESKEPFFYWLDVGEGKEINLESKCPRSKLQKQCIKYLGPKEREVYEVIVEDGKFLYKQSRKVLDTSEGSEDSKWIFVLSTSKSLYVGQKLKGTFQHSSFLAGGATSAAGRLVVKDGVLKAVWPHSGHYRPTAENFQDFMSFLKRNHVDLTDVKKSPTEEDDELRVLKSFHSGLKTEQSSTIASSETSNTSATKIVISCSQSRRTVSSNSPIALRPDTDESENFMKGQNTDQGVSNIDTSLEEGPIKSKQHYIFCKKNLFVEEQEEEGEASVPQELILQRINSKKKLESYQLGKQLSCRWTTGAGPRIGCVRDYPSELQFRSLEQVNLSPRSPGGSRTYPSPRITSAQSPRLPELPPMIVPLLEKPNIHRFKRRA